MPVGLEFETVLVNIDVPRTTEYLAINPSGLVPAFVYDGHVLTESGLIAHFLADSHPSQLLKSSSAPDGALQRFAIRFFVNTFFTKARSLFDTAVLFSGEEEITATNKYIDAIVNHIEPLLADAAPFSGGSCRLTLAEDQRFRQDLSFFACLHPPRMREYYRALFSKPSRWRHAVISERSVTAVWDEDDVVKRTLERIQTIMMGSGWLRSE